MSGTSRPFKVWSADRINRKSVTASTLEDLKVKGTVFALRIVIDDTGYWVADFRNPADKSAYWKTIFFISVVGT